MRHFLKLSGAAALGAAPAAAQRLAGVPDPQGGREAIELTCAGCGGALRGLKG